MELDLNSNEWSCASDEDLNNLFDDRLLLINIFLCNYQGSWIISKIFKNSRIHPPPLFFDTKILLNKMIIYVKLGRDRVAGFIVMIFLFIPLNYSIHYETQI